MKSDTLEMDPDLPVSLQRKWISNKADHSVRSIGCFGVLSYNILNGNLVPEGMYPYCLQELLRTPSSRHPLLMKEIDHHKNDVDIICMQEVNNKYYEDVLLSDMKARGFDGHYVGRLSGKDEFAKTDGSATFYKTGRFQLVKCVHGHFKELFEKEREKMGEKPGCDVSKLLISDRAFIFSLFQCNETKRCVAVGNIHTTFDLWKEMNLTTLEVAFAINELIAFCGGPDVPHILCGDLNQEPHFPGYQLLHDGRLNETMATYLRNSHHSQENNQQSQPLVDIFSHCFRHNSSSLRSAYKTVVGHEVPFSCYEDGSAYFKVPRREKRSPAMQALFDGTPDNPQVRKNDPEAYGSEKYISALDFVWYSSASLLCEGILEMVDEAVILPFHACPNAVFPSDHMPIKARFSFLES